MIADEPTTALDVVMQAQILELLERLREQLGLALILISHDLGVLAETCDRIAVMYAGRIVETGPVREVFDAPQHPYTKRLLDSLPVIGGARELAPPIPGGPPDPGELPQGCRFLPRCPYAAEALPRGPAAARGAPGQAAACHFAPWAEWPPVQRHDRRGRGSGRMSAALMEVARPGGALPRAPRRSRARSTASRSNGGAARSSAWSGSRAAASPRWRGRCSAWWRPRPGDRPRRRSRWTAGQRCASCAGTCR